MDPQTAARSFAQATANRDQQPYAIYTRRKADRPLTIAATGRAIFGESITIFVCPAHDAPPADVELTETVQPEDPK